MTTLKCSAGYNFCACPVWRSCVNKIYNKILLFLVFISVLKLIFFNTLSDFSSNLFFVMHIVRVCKEFIFLFRPCKHFFQYFSSGPSRKIMILPLYIFNFNVQLKVQDRSAACRGRNWRASRYQRFFPKPFIDTKNCIPNYITFFLT